jgi:hypothetical protein
MGVKVRATAEADQDFHVIGTTSRDDCRHHVERGFQIANHVGGESLNVREVHIQARMRAVSSKYCLQVAFGFGPGTRAASEERA